MTSNAIYTYGVVVATLAAIEAPNADAYNSLNANSDHDKPAGGMEPALGDATSKPITTDLQTAEKHLRQHTGCWYRYRGLSMALTHRLVKVFLIRIAPLQDTNLFGWFVYNAVIETLLSNLHVALLHIIISRPSPKRFYQRIPGLSSWIQIAPIAALSSVATSADFYLPLGLIRFFGERDGSHAIPKATGLCEIVIILISTALLYFAAVAPARAIFIRVAASMLPEQDKPIVAFDRTFGGKVIPVVLGGSGKVSIPDAWRSFHWAARVRYLNAFAKAFALQVVCWFLLVLFVLPLDFDAKSAMNINFLA
ncbi:hypothetical protein Asppvi_004431 [Aspergillus pseudoviridinutans]|uniref:Uncharacterized protein n=1 Tax=Aspergillus pseudoviridinutans TaxID=1517512 RepID=A0A9P3B6D3_9EURO|nr:uncharacterized protein Asppvi_004431 [Aspergillus pseudoviridinutans]GIJ85572.1 hypothetical protein Asppvi_004431 [Aspergillus pseudoviridinutans]